MNKPHLHDSHPRISARLKRARGHLDSVITMMDEGRPCTEIAQQLHAVERAITNAKRALIHDHIDHCLDEVNVEGTADFKEITRYL